LGNSQALRVQDLPRSRSGNAARYTVFGKQYQVMDSAKGFTERGIASWYGSKFHGRATASGEKYNMYDMTAAHKNLPIPVFVRVKNLDNGRELIVKVNDRGPFIEGRIIDLSFAAARKLGVYDSGTANVEIEALSEAYRKSATPATQVVNSPSLAQPAKVESASVPSDAKYAWVVQLGAFQDAANASVLLNQVDSNLAAQRSINHDKDAQLYRVIVGPVSTIEEADALRLTLASTGFDGYTLKARLQ
jgi:rare lipoprotein A